MKPAPAFVLCAIAALPASVLAADDTEDRTPTPAAQASDSAPAGSAYTPFFIGNTIANLRGLDPVFPQGRTLTLIDGRRTGARGEAPAAPTRASTTRALDLPADWPGGLVAERRSCIADACDGKAELLLLRDDGTARVFAQGRMLAEGTFDAAGALHFSAAGRGYTASIPAP